MPWTNLMMNNLHPFSRIAWEAEGAGGTAGAGEAGGTASGGGAEPPVSPPAGEAAPPATALTNGGEAPAGEAPATGEAPVAETPPIDLSALTLPEGMTLPEDLGTAFNEALTSPDLSPQERGQKLIDLYSTSVQQLQEANEAASTEAWLALNEEWREATRALPEFAKNFEGELGAIKQALIASGADEEFFSVIDLTGVGNNPHVLRVLHKLTAPLREGGAVGGGATPARTRSGAEIMFPSMQPKG